MAKVYLDSGDNFTLSSAATVYGSTGTEKVVVNSGVTGVTIDASVERVDLSGASSAYTFKQAGNTLQVYSGTTLVATTTVQDDTNGSQLVFSNGSVDVKMATGGTMTLGGATVSSTAAGAVTPTTIDASTTSGSGTGGSGGGSTAGQTFSLTTGVDNLVGGSGDDTYVGIAGTGATSAAYDAINGGAGNDTLKIYTDGAVTLPGTLTSIESLYIYDTVHQATDISTTAMLATGVKTLTLAGGTTVAAAAMAVTTTTGQSVTYENLLDGDAADDTADNKGEIDITTAAATADLLAAITSVDLTVKDVGASPALDDIDFDVVNAAVKTINLTSNGSANFVGFTNTGAGVNTLNIVGAGNITITDTALPAGLKTVNAATATGKVAVSLGANASTVTGGTVDDTFVFGANYVGAEATVASGTRDIVNGGTGTDTISMEIAQVAAASTTVQSNLTSIEALAISDAWTTGKDINITKFSDVTKVTLAAATAGTSTMTVNSGTTVVLAGDTAANSITSFAVAGSGTSDSITLKMDGLDFAGTGTETFTGIETLNINTGTLIVDAATFAAALTMAPTAGGTSKIVVTGNNAMTFTGVVTAAEIDASGVTASTGILTVTGTAANAIKITGGAAADVINGSAAADVIKGGNGADSIISGNGLDSIDLTETTSAVDTVVLDITGSGYADTITAFTTQKDILKADTTITGTVTIGTQTAAGGDKTAAIANVTAAANTDADVYYINNAKEMTVTELETALTAGSAATGEAIIIVDNGVNGTNVYYDAAVQTDAGSGAGMILLATLVGITGTTALATGDIVLV